MGDPDFPRGCVWSGGDDEAGAVEGAARGDSAHGLGALRPEAQIKLLGVAEVLGAIGLVAPMATGIAPFLTRAAAACLAALMGGAVATHMNRREPAAVATALAALTIVVATFR